MDKKYNIIKSTKCTLEAKAYAERARKECREDSESALDISGGWLRGKFGRASGAVLIFQYSVAVGNERTIANEY